MFRTRDEIEQAERQEMASKSRIAHFRVIAKCPVCQDGIQNRVIEESQWSVKIKTDFRCGLVVLTDGTYSKLEAPCKRPTEDALRKLGEGFYLATKEKASPRRRAAAE